MDAAGDWDVLMKRPKDLDLLFEVHSGYLMMYYYFYSL